jgi:four helix bundle protein
MTYKRFEDLPVWRAAQDFALRVYQLTDHPAVARVTVKGGDLADQLRRSSPSISNNIAEGFERGTTPELLMFLYIARGSAGESRSMLHFASRLPALADLQPQVSVLLPLAEACSKQLQSWADSLQNSPIKGQRHLNDHVRDAFTRHRRAAAFLETLRAATPHMHHPQHPEPEDPKSES